MSVRTTLSVLVVSFLAFTGGSTAYAYMLPGDFVKSYSGGPGPSSSSVSSSSSSASSVTIPPIPSLGSSSSSFSSSSSQQSSSVGGGVGGGGGSGGRRGAGSLWKSADQRRAARASSQSSIQNPVVPVAPVQVTPRASQGHSAAPRSNLPGTGPALGIAFVSSLGATLLYRRIRRKRRAE